MSSRLSSLLVQDGVVSAAKMADALQRQVIQGGALDSNLLETKAIEEDALVGYLGKAASLPMQPTGIAAMGKPLPDILEVFTQEVALRFRAVPTTLRSGGVLQVLVTVDSVISDIDSLALVIRQRIEPWVVLEFRLHEALEKVYGVAVPTRFARLLQRSQKAHEGKSYPSARLIDPIPRFGSLSTVRLAGPPMSEATAALLVGEAIAAGVTPAAVAVPASAAVSATEKTEAMTVPASTVASPTEKTEAMAVPAAAVPSGTEKTAALAVPATDAAAVEKTEALPVPVVDVAAPTPSQPAASRVDAVPPLAVPPQATVDAQGPAAPVRSEPAAVAAAEPTPPAVVSAPPSIRPAPVEPVAAPAVARAAAPAAVEPAAPAAPSAPAAVPASASSDGVPRSSRSAPSYSGIDQLSMDEWESVSAADWLSVANKIEPVEATAEPTTLPDLPAVPTIPAAPTAHASASPAAKVEAVAKPTAPASTSSPTDGGRRGKKRNKGQPQPTAQTAQQKPAPATAPAPAPTPATTVAQAAPVQAAGKDAARPAGPATQKALPAVVAKPAVAASPAVPASAKSVPARPQPAAASQSNPAVKPAPVSKPAVAVAKPAAPSTVSGKQAVPPTAEKPAVAKPAPGQATSAPAVASKPATPPTPTPVSTAEKSQPTAVAPVKAKPTTELPVVAKPAESPAASPAPAAASQPTAATSSAAAAKAAVPESIPEPINSGRLGEPISSLRPEDLSSEPPPSSESPEATDGDDLPRPAPRIALALDESSGATLSLEAARELVAVAADRDAIFEALCRGARSRARFACIFTIHGEVAFGRVALEDTWLDRQHVGRVSVPLDRPSVFRQAAKSRQQHVGALGDPAVTNDPLRALGRRPPIPGAVLPILLRGRPVALLYLDDDGRELSESLWTELQPLLSEVGQAFHRLVQQSKSGGLGGVADLEDGASPHEVSDAGTSAWRPRSQNTPAPAIAAAPAPTTPAATAPVAAPVAAAPIAAPVAAAVAAPVAAPAPTQPAAEPTQAVPKVDPAAPVPVAASEQPTVPLRVDRTKQAATATASKAQPAEKGPAASAAPSGSGKADKTDKVEKIESSPKQTGKHSKGSNKSPATSTVSPANKESGKDAGKDGTKDGRKEAPAAREDWAALIEKAAGGDESAAQAILAGDEAAVQALVAALPGPLRSQERSAVGDPQSAEANLAHSPLLSLVLRVGARAVSPLVARLKQKDTPARARFFIVQLFGEMPVAATMDPLFDSLYDADEEVRAAAAAALRNFPPSQALSALRGRLRDALDSQQSADPKRLVATVDALGELRDTMAVQPVIDLLDARDPLLVDSAGRALQAITKQDFGRSRYRWSGWWRRHQYEPRLQWLLSGLCHDSAMIRSSAQDELSEMSGDVAGYRFDLPNRERESTAKQWAKWWQRHGYDVV